MFGYSPPSPGPGLCRDVYKWVFSLNMNCPLNHLRRDLSNGFYVAELLSRFYPADVQMHSYQNGTSERCKQDNWDQIRKVCQKNDLLIPDKLIEGTIHGAPGAAVAVLETLYEKFTHKKVQRFDGQQQAGQGGSAPATAAAAALQAVSFGEPAATADGNGLRAIKASHTATANIEFGAVHMQQATADGASLRRKFGQAAGQGVPRS